MRGPVRLGGKGVKDLTAKLSGSAETGSPRIEQNQRTEADMSKRARKRRDRKRGGANHGKRPNT